MRPFAPGEWIRMREVWNDRTWEIRNGIIVEDASDFIAIYTPPHTPAMVAMGSDGVRLRIPPDEWVLSKVKTPADRRFLAIHPTGAEHSLLAIWDDAWRMICWYINLESDLGRHDYGVEYQDRFLDVIAEPDLSSWRWKDEDELEEAMKLGLVNPAQAASFRAEGERAIEWLLARRAPYDRPWQDWWPPADWNLSS